MIGSSMQAYSKQNQLLSVLVVRCSRHSVRLVLRPLLQELLRLLAIRLRSLMLPLLLFARLVLIRRSLVHGFVRCRLS